MAFKFNTARAYLSFDELVRVVENNLFDNIRSILGYSSKVIAARVAQRFVEVSLVPFMYKCAQEMELDEIDLASEPVEFSGFGIVSETKISLSNKVLLKALGEFLIHALHVLVIMVSYTFKPNNKISNPSTLMFGVGVENITRNGSDAEFIQFCKKGKVKPLNKAHSIIVQSTQRVTSGHLEYATYSQFPLMQLIRNNPPSFLQLGAFLITHAKASVAYFKQVYHCSLVSLIGRDFAYHAMAKYLNQKQLIENITITNSNYTSQPLWMRKFKGRNFNTHMIWYSQNTIPFTYVNDPVRVPLPNNRHIFVDESWVWTQEYANYLSEIGVKSITNVIGPIVWYIPKPIYPFKSNSEFKITVFDVTPVTKTFAEEIGLFYNYYNTENCIKFIQDIVSTCEAIKAETGIKVSIALKPKRGYQHQPLNDENYINLIKQLNASAQISLIDPEADLFDLIASSKLVVVIPYSSPANIANYLGVPSVYFDATQELVPTYEETKHTYFASGKDNLYNFVLKVIGESKQKLPHTRDSRKVSDA